MPICQSTLFSMLVTAGLVAAAIDTVDSGPGAVLAITIQQDANASFDPQAFRPVVDLLNEYAPRSRVEVLERNPVGEQSRKIYILVRHPRRDYLEDAIESMRASDHWADALEDLEQTGYSIEKTELLLDRTPN